MGHLSCSWTNFIPKLAGKTIVIIRKYTILCICSISSV